MNLKPDSGAFPGAQLRKHWRWADLLSISLFTVILLVGGTVALFFGYRFIVGAQPAASGLPLMFTAILTGLEGVAIFAAFGIFAIWRRRMTLQDLDLEFPASEWWWLYALILSIIAIPVMGGIATLFQYIFDLPIENPQLEVLAPPEVSIPASLVMLGMGGIIAPVAEELLFRGLFHRFLRQYWSFLPAAFLSSLLFGLLHGEISIAVATFAMGLLLAWVYERSRSLWPAIVIHIVNNSVKLLLLYLLIALGIDIPTGF